MRTRHRKPTVKTLLHGWTFPLAEGTAPVTIVAVSPPDPATSPDTITWSFNSDVTSVRGSLSQLQASADGSSFVSPSSSSMTDDGDVLTTYDGTPLPPGSVVRINQVPNGLLFESGSLAIPQSGTVISAEQASTLKEQARTLKPQARAKKAPTVKAKPKPKKTAKKTITVQAHTRRKAA